MSNAIDWICAASMSEATQRIECNTIETHHKGERPKNKINCQLGSEENICLWLLIFFKSYLANFKSLEKLSHLHF